MLVMVRRIHKEKLDHDNLIKWGQLGTPQREKL